MALSSDFMPDPGDPSLAGPTPGEPQAAQLLQPKLEHPEPILEVGNGLQSTGVLPATSMWTSSDDQKANSANGGTASTSSSPSFGAGLAHPNGALLPSAGTLVAPGPIVPVSGMIPTPMSNGSAGPAGAQGPGMPVQMHEPALAVEWTAEEQKLLEEGLTRFPGDKYSNIVRCIKIAAMLADKTVRDVAMRCRWMSKKEIGKRRKDEQQQSQTKKSKESKKDKPGDMHRPLAPARPPVPIMAPPPMPPLDDKIPPIGGPTGQLLDENVRMVNQIRQNLANCKIQENNELLVKFRDNITTIINGMTSMPGILSSMPPLPVKLNTPLADSFLPPSKNLPLPPPVTTPPK
ncbi:hypothetical protein KFL_000480090 [Klebsormidium nitens]|uniref:Myb-like domain-containing protein n=1 Tax=Klebsormidium nitens TaxID=105231 RepID=A0A1Y1HWE6_KLENI|nr:hypothetical protein KFL_000480090 [Klebsormidium nitens]|eukprot:GAQ80168.1 hypothetical protein KFL_000480090 [Klebsormidium nitens]